LPTLPGRIDMETAVNPFMRCDEPAVIDAARQHGCDSDDAVAVFTALRQWKNGFQ
jgi:hydroxyacylglutathione hydrolase